MAAIRRKKYYYYKPTPPKKGWLSKEEQKQLQDLEKIVSAAFGIGSFLKKNNEESYVIARSLFYRLAKDKGYTVTALSVYAGFPHSTASCSIKNFPIYAENHKAFRTRIIDALNQWQNYLNKKNNVSII